MKSSRDKPDAAAYRFQFLRAAKEEWDKLDGSVRLQFTKAMAKRLQNPRVPKAALLKMPDCYKIKLRDVGYRLIYQIHDDQLILLTIAVGRRDKSQVYEMATERLKQMTEDAVRAGSKSGASPPQRKK